MHDFITVSSLQINFFFLPVCFLGFMTYFKVDVHLFIGAANPSGADLSYHVYLLHLCQISSCQKKVGKHQVID